MTIRKATSHDIPLIHQLANETWWPTYKGIIPDEQISFMLNEMYSVEALAAQFNEVDFLIAERNDQPVAFAAMSETDVDNRIFKLHKIYILPTEQGKGTGKALIQYIEDLVRLNNGRMLELNVNRANPAFGFYEKLGFRVFEEVDIPYYGFVLNDYVMRKGV